VVGSHYKEDLHSVVLAG